METNKARSPAGEAKPVCEPRTSEAGTSESTVAPWLRSHCYIICTTARSGSNLFCNFLANTRVLGRPVEAFNPDIVRRSKFFSEADDQHAVSTTKYISWLTDRQRTPNGIFGTKLLFEDFDMFRGFQSFSDLFQGSMLIHLRRRSKLRQAISYYFAEQTGQWVASDPARLDSSEVPFDYDAIDRHLRRLIAQDVAWTSILNGLCMNYLEVYFEDFLSNPELVIYQIIDRLGIKTQNVPIYATLKEQKNSMTSQFLKAFEVEMPARVFLKKNLQIYKEIRFHD